MATDDFDPTLLPFYAKAYNRYRCICRTQKCQELTRLFQSKQDQRGANFVLPNTKEGSQKANLTPTKERKAELARLHLRASEEDSYAFDRRNQTKGGEPLSTRAAAQQVKQGRRHVACHHFHPKVLWYVRKKRQYKWVDSIPVDWIRVNIQANGTENNGYSKNDRHSNGGYYMVPSYPVSAAEDDYRLLEAAANIRATVTEVTTIPGIRSRRSNGTLARSSRDSSGSETSVGTSTGSPSTISDDSTTSRRYEDIIRHLNERLENAQDKISYLESTIENSKTANSPERGSLLDSEVELLQGKYAGINRLSITSNRFHEFNGRIANELFGFPSWSYTKDFLKAMFWLEHEEPTAVRAKSRLTKLEQCLIALIHLETGYGQLMIANFFGLKGHTQISQCINLWVPEWGKVGVHLSVLPFIDAEFLDATEPQSYIDLGLRKVGAIIDGKDFYTETVRKDRAVSTAQQGNKLGKSSFRILTWSTPTGLVFEHTKPVFARATEKKLNCLWAKHGRLKIPPGYIISGDKGFEGTAGFYPNHNTVIHPAFLYGEAQFSPEKIGWNHRACQLRYTCEAVYSRVTNRETLYGFVRRNRFHLFEDACAWAHGRANLYLPLQMPRGAEMYFEVTTRHKANKKRKRSVEV